MKNKNLTKLYDRLTSEERLRLAIEALARGDDEEIDRLNVSCPYKTYTQTDVAYAIPVKASHDLIQGVCQDLDLARGGLEVIRSCQLLITTLDKNWLASKTEGEEGWVEETREKLQWVSEILRICCRGETIIMLKMILEGLDHFCKSKFSLDSGTVLKAFAERHWEWLEDLQDEIATVEAPPEDVADYEKSLIKEWNIRIAILLP